MLKEYRLPGATNVFGWPPQLYPQIFTKVFPRESLLRERQRTERGVPHFKTGRFFSFLARLIHTCACLISPIERQEFFLWMNCGCTWRFLGSAAFPPFPPLDGSQEDKIEAAFTSSGGGEKKYG